MRILREGTPNSPGGANGGTPTHGGLFHLEPMVNMNCFHSNTIRGKGGLALPEKPRTVSGKAGACPKVQKTA